LKAEQEDQGVNIGITIIFLQALNLRGTLKYLRGDFESAVEDLTAALETESHSDTYIKRATVKYEQKKVEDCFADFKKAVELNPDNVDVYYHRGQVPLHFDRLIKLQFLNFLFYFIYSQAHFVSGNLQDALSDYEKCSSMNPDAPHSIIFFLSFFFLFFPLLFSPSYFLSP